MMQIIMIITAVIIIMIMNLIITMIMLIARTLSQALRARVSFKEPGRGTDDNT